MAREKKVVSVSPPVHAMTNADRCRLYREKRKKDPAYLLKEKERKQRYRLNRSAEKREHEQLLCRNRMKKLRQKHQSEVHVHKTSKVEKHRTRQQVIIDRQKWSETKRKYRSGLSAQKQRRIREKDRKQKKEKRRLIKAARPEYAEQIQGEQATAYNTPSAARKAVSRAYQHFPKNPKKFSSVLEGVLKKAENHYGHHATSRNQKTEFLENTAKTFRDVYQSLKVTRQKKDVRLRRIMARHLAKMKKYRLLRKSSRELGFRWGSLTKWSQIHVDNTEINRMHKGALPQSTTAAVKDFYLKPYISVSHAGKKTVLKRLGMQKQTMSVTLKAAHETFQSENPTKPVSFAKFAKLKPKQVETLKNEHFRTCLCETCTNIEMMLKVINSHAVQPASKIKDKYQASDITLCAYERGHHPDVKCTERKCDKCGVTRMAKHLSLVAASTEEVTYYQWENCKVFCEKTKTDKNRKVLVQKVCELKELVTKFLDALSLFSSHLFCSTWQHKKFCEVKSSLREGHILSVLDFAENYTVQFQDECQSAHWCKKQITVHPVVSYYRQDNVTKTHEMVFVSDDVTHDHHMVNHITSTYIEALREEGCTITKVTQFTDGCSGQYKSKVPFMDISFAPDDFKVQFERNYFGSGHGKGPSDGCSGVVKSAVTRATKGGTVVVRDAQEFFSFCSSELSKDSLCFKRSFHFISSQDILRERPERTNASTLAGTRKLHCVHPTGKAGALKVRELSCSCNFCVYEEGDRCVDKNVDPWKFVSISKTRKRKSDKENNPKSAKKTKKSSKPENKNMTETWSKRKTGNSCKEGKDILRSSENSVVRDNQSMEDGYAFPLEDTINEAVGWKDPFFGTTGIQECSTLEVHLESNSEGPLPVDMLGQPVFPESATDGQDIPVIMESSFLDSHGIKCLDTEMTLFDELTGVRENHELEDLTVIGNRESMRYRYSVGNYVKVGVGREKYPAVIVETPPTMEALPEMGLWVKYFRQASSSTWSMDDKEFFVDFKDILAELPAPLLESTGGSRFSYKFESLTNLPG